MSKNVGNFSLEVFQRVLDIVKLFHKISLVSTLLRGDSFSIKDGLRHSNKLGARNSDMSSIIVGIGNVFGLVLDLAAAHLVGTRLGGLVITIFPL